VFLYWDDIFGRQLSEDRMTREQALEQARRWRGRSAIRDEIHHRTYVDPEKAARKLLEIANSVEAVQDGRIYIEKINYLFHTGRCRIRLRDARR
jgi:hypothetical protein